MERHGDPVRDINLAALWWLGTMPAGLASDAAIHALAIESPTKDQTAITDFGGAAMAPCIAAAPAVVRR